MAQHDYIISNATFPAVRTDINNALSAIQTTNSGTSRPTGAVAGQLWLDTTSATTPTLKYYDGADDISLATIDHSANTVNWLDSTVSITGLSTTATGTVLTLSDSATTSTVNLIIDNDKEIRFREATANGTNYVSLSAPASLSADLTFTLPATDGTSGQALVTNGSGVLSFASAGLAWQTIVTASTLTAVSGRGYWIDTTSNACTITLPASATNGDTIILVDYARKWGTNKITINQNSLKFQGYTSPNPEYNTNGQSVTLVYSGATKGWIPTVDDDVTYEVPQTYSVDFLVVAGGAGGGGNDGAPGPGGGGGGAGGYRNSFSTETSGGGGSSEATLTFDPGVVYTITVGGGGAGAPPDGNSPGTPGTTGTNSSISGTGITTITSSGGGGGSGRNGNGVSGGSGGGAGGSTSPATTGGSGTANQGFAGGNGVAQGGGGGGGSSAVGSNGVSPSTGGAGGAGLASSITGSSVTRAGGGGGGGITGGSAGTGGAGAGGGPAGSGTSATVNTGSGGGGGGIGTTSGGAGGKGVLILRMPTASYSGTTTGSPTVTTSGSDTILVFNDSGTITG
jgi:hypothetical protein